MRLVFRLPPAWPNMCRETPQLVTRRRLSYPAEPMPRRTFYPEIQPYRAGYLEVSPEHSIYFEESGNPRGKPAVFLHGGPGGGTSPKQRRFFDPARYRIVL